MSRLSKRLHQREKRKDRRSGKVKKQSDLYELIDGNLSYYPYAFCEHYNGWLTLGQIRTHKCLARHCKQIRIIKTGTENISGADVRRNK